LPRQPTRWAQQQRPEQPQALPDPAAAIFSSRELSIQLVARADQAGPPHSERAVTVLLGLLLILFGLDHPFGSPLGLRHHHRIPPHPAAATRRRRPQRSTRTSENLRQHPRPTPPRRVLTRPLDRITRISTTPAASKPDSAGSRPTSTRLVGRPTTSINEFTVPILTGEATTNSTRTNRHTGSTDTQGDAEVGSSEEQPLYRTMSARLSDDQFMEDWRRRSREIRNPASALSQGQEPARGSKGRAG